MEKERGIVKKEEWNKGGGRRDGTGGKREETMEKERGNKGEVGQRKRRGGIEGKWEQNREKGGTEQKEKRDGAERKEGWNRKKRGMEQKEKKDGTEGKKEDSSAVRLLSECGVSLAYQEAK
ncbi:MAG: hypothetical protein ACI4BD_02110 [Paludibacteraceae bacterium]